MSKFKASVKIRNILTKGKSVLDKLSKEIGKAERIAVAVDFERFKKSFSGVGARQGYLRAYFSDIPKDWPKVQYLKDARYQSLHYCIQIGQAMDEAEKLAKLSPKALEKHRKDEKAKREAKLTPTKVVYYLSDFLAELFTNGAFTSSEFTAWTQAHVRLVHQEDFKNAYGGMIASKAVKAVKAETQDTEPTMVTEKWPLKSVTPEEYAKTGKVKKTRELAKRILAAA